MAGAMSIYLQLENAGSPQTCSDCENQKKSLRCLLEVLQTQMQAQTCLQACLVLIHALMVQIHSLTNYQRQKAWCDYLPDMVNSCQLQVTSLTRDC